MQSMIKLYRKLANLVIRHSLSIRCGRYFQRDRSQEQEFWFDIDAHSQTICLFTWYHLGNLISKSKHKKIEYYTYFNLFQMHSSQIAPLYSSQIAHCNCNITIKMYFYMQCNFSYLITIIYGSNDLLYSHWPWYLMPAIIIAGLYNFITSMGKLMA